MNEQAGPDDQNNSDQLPELSDDVVERIETAVFSRIAADRVAHGEIGDRPRSRRRRWLTAVGVAAAFVAGVLVTPPILDAVGGSASSTAESVDMSGGSAAESSADAPDKSAEIAPGDTGAAESADVPSVVGTDIADSDREIIATAHATVEVDDIQGASAEITGIAEERGGYVESAEIGGVVGPDADSDSVPAQTDSEYGWITVRIPSADLSDVIDTLSASGEVVSSSIAKQDVTSTAIDLRARADATRASVERLTALMAQSGSVTELIEAEVALTERQAQLESYEQQLASLEDQVAMSTLRIELTRSAAPGTADPAGFTDGLLAGWNGLVASLNALVIALGFLLPWLAIAGGVVLIIWLIRRVRRGGRRQVTGATGPETD